MEEVARKDTLSYHIKADCNVCLFGLHNEMQKWCKACVLLDGLNRGLPKMGIGRARGGVNGDHKKETEKPAYAAKSIESYETHISQDD